MLFSRKSEAQRETLKATERELIRAIQRADDARAFEIIKDAEACGDKAALDEPDSHGSSPLIRAMANNMESVAVCLVRAGASLLARNELGEGALGMAIKVGACKAAMAIIERLDAEGPAGPAWEALSDGPASLNWEEQKPGPLMLAIELGHEEIALALAKSSAPISKKDLRTTPLLCAAIEAKMRAVAMALTRRLASGDKFEKGALRKVGALRQPPLFEAIKISDEALAVELVRAGASPFDWSWGGETALGQAIGKGMRTLAIEIIDNIDDRGKTCLEEIGQSSDLLRRAIDSSQEQVAEAIIKKDGKIESGLEAETLLISAIDGGLDGVALAIVERAAAMPKLAKEPLLEGEDRRGFSPLALAALRGKERICVALVAAGANIGRAKQALSKNSKANELLLAAESGGHRAREAEARVAAQALRARERLAKALLAVNKNGDSSEDSAKKAAARRARQQPQLARPKACEEN